MDQWRILSVPVPVPTSDKLQIRRSQTASEERSSRLRIRLSIVISGKIWLTALSQTASVITSIAIGGKQHTTVAVVVYIYCSKSDLLYRNSRWHRQRLTVNSEARSRRRRRMMISIAIGGYQRLAQPMFIF